MIESPDDLFKRLDPDGRYTDVSRIGTGGMGTVYRALDTRLQIPVAIKVLHQSHVQALVRFQQEARALSRLRHEGIVKVLDFVSSENELMLIMEYVDGRTVRQILDEQGVYKPEDAIRIAHAISVAIKHAHANDIIHRDLKPDNVIVTTDGAIKILDFGIAKFLQSSDVFGTLTRAGQLIGSPLYMSPEQLQGQDATAQTDVYGLGLLLFHMLTNRSPFGGETVPAMLEERLHKLPAKIQELQPDATLGAEIDKIIGNALAADQNDRYSEMSLMEYDLHALTLLDQHTSETAGTAIQQTESTAPAPSKASKLTLLAISVASIAILFIGIAMFLIQTRETPEKVLQNRIKATEQIPIIEKSAWDEELVAEPSKDLERFPPGFISENEQGKGSIPFSKATEPVTDQKMEAIRSSKIHYLSFKDSQSLTAEHLKMLAGLPIYALDLRGTTTGIEGLATLHELPQLDWLLLSRTDFKDEYVSALGKLPRLTQLELHACSGLTNVGLAQIVKAYPNLRLLDVGETSINTLNPVAQLKRLWTLRAGKTAITDRDIAYLQAPLKEIAIIACPNLTDKTLETLAKIKTLKRVSIMGCPQITARAAREFTLTTRIIVALGGRQRSRTKVRDEDAITDTFAELGTFDEDSKSKQPNRIEDTTTIQPTPAEDLKTTRSSPVAE